MTLETIKIALEKSGLSHEIHPFSERSTSLSTVHQIGIKFSDKTPVWDWFELTQYTDGDIFFNYKNGYSQNTGTTYRGWKRKFAAYNRFEKVTGIKIP